MDEVQLPEGHTFCLNNVYIHLKLKIFVNATTAKQTAIVANISSMLLTDRSNKGATLSHWYAPVHHGP